MRASLGGPDQRPRRFMHILAPVAQFTAHRRRRAWAARRTRIPVPVRRYAVLESLRFRISLRGTGCFLEVAYFEGCELGFRYRKSKSFGPVRITASKRGVSASIGAGP